MTEISISTSFGKRNRLKALEKHLSARRCGGSVMFSCRSRFAKLMSILRVQPRKSYGHSKQCMLFKKDRADPLCVQPEMDILKEKKKPNPEDFYKVRLESQEEGDASPLEFIKRKNAEGFERLEAEINKERGVSEFDTTRQHEIEEEQEAERAESEKGLKEKLLDGLDKVEEIIDKHDIANPNKRIFDHPIYVKQAIMPPLTPEQEEVVRFGVACGTHFNQQKPDNEKGASNDESNIK